ncbi:hypothetical protein CROQUDRAFT_664176 [Cronartium quercuum f. sp. fusiforme G11]|uniref:O-fucosyltransferase family protein n=1 Tax=Cronartium quercuum f. sp. fusiforme G11 TaxID=708437 RepID=A0A9P6N7Q9_9BASI|nr:hypothetical protein CROQUDRAFT_664176 [Cronartium quercuum f. sp. fusiforme G11]
MPFKSSTLTPKHSLPPSSSSPFFALITPSHHRPVSHYTPISQSEDDSFQLRYAGSQSNHNENIHQSRHRSSRTDVLSYPADFPAHRSYSRLQWLAGLAGAMLLAMLLCSNRLGTNNNLVLPFRTAERPLNRTNDSSSDSPSLKLAPIKTGSLSATQPLVNAGMKFLFPVRIGEQETKASSHLLQLGLLARSLNRTLVLPHAGGGYFTQCAPLSFETYYAPDALARWGIPTISQSELQSSASHDLKARHLVFTRQPANGPLNISTLSRPVEDPQETTCLSPGLTTCLKILPEHLVVRAPSGFHHSKQSRSAFSQSLVSELVSQHHIEVLLVTWKLLYPIFDPVPAFNQLEYNPALGGLAERLIKILGGPSNVLGFHWRQETVPLEVIKRCTALLEDKLGGGSEEWLWMASDYPFENLIGPTQGDGIHGSAHSATFPTLTPSHHASMTKLVSKLQKHAQNTLQHKPTSLRTLLSIHALEDPVVKSFLDRFGEERGVLGIVEKLVLVKIDRILMGSESTERKIRCSKGSSYSRQIVKMHNELTSRIGEGSGMREVGFWA